ncbi:MAG: flagellar hook-basal body complex protein FliE [Myxococcota bacterium]
MKIEGIESQLDLLRVQEAAGAGGFGDALLGAIENVARSQDVAGGVSENFLNDPNAKIHETMIQLEKAGIQLKTFVTMRNKMLDAYREIMRMGA